MLRRRTERESVCVAGDLYLRTGVRRNGWRPVLIDKCEGGNGGNYVL